MKARTEVGPFQFGRARVGVSHWVYLYLDDNAEAPTRHVLYVGFTNNMLHRDTYHRRQKMWWRALATRLMLFEYPDRESAYISEGRAILRYAPVGNLTNNPRRAEVHREFIAQMWAEQQNKFWRKPAA